MPYKTIVPEGSAPPLAPYSPGARAGNAVYVSGVVALDAEGNLVGAGDAKAQTRHVLEAIRSISKRPGGLWRILPSTRFLSATSATMPE